MLDVIDILSELNVAGAVLGAFAVSFYGVPRSTKDADLVVWLQSSGKTSHDIAGRSTASGYTAKISRGDADDPIREAIIVNDKYENQVDVLIGIQGMDPNAVSRSISESFLDSSIQIIAAEDLIGMKINAGGPQDLQDVRGILQVSGDSLDFDLLRRVVERYGPDAVRQFEELLRYLEEP